MVTCGSIVFPKVLWIQHPQIIFDFDDMVQTSKSMLMIINLHKTEISHIILLSCLVKLWEQ